MMRGNIFYNVMKTLLNKFTFRAGTPGVPKPPAIFMKRKQDELIRFYAWKTKCEIQEAERYIRTLQEEIDFNTDKKQVAIDILFNLMADYWDHITEKA